MQDTYVSEGDYWQRQEQIYKRSYITLALLAINVAIFLMSSFMWHIPA